MTASRVPPLADQSTGIIGLTAGQILSGSPSGTIGQESALAWSTTLKQFALTGTVSKVSAAGSAWDTFSMPAATLTLTGGVTVSTATGVNLVSLRAPTITSPVATTVATGSTFYVAGPPTAAGSVTLTTPLAMWVDDGIAQFDLQVKIGSPVETPLVTNAPLMVFGSGNVFAIVRQTTADVELAFGCLSTAGVINTQSSHPLILGANNNAGFLQLETDGRISGNHIHNPAGAVTGTSAQYIASGTYTPTLTAQTNVAASTPRVTQWIRVGNVVLVAGQLDIDPTAAALTQLGVSLPIASNLANSFELGGTANAPSITAANAASAAIVGDAANDRATITWTAVDITNQTWAFSFTYQVL